MKMFASLPLYIVTILFAFGCVSGKSCPNRWVLSNKHCYLVSKSDMTWNEAQDFCRNLDAELVKIDNNQENAFVLGLFRQEGISQIWIGLKSELRWYDCSVPIYTNWDSGEPSGQAVTPCTMMKSSGSWDDIHCANNIASVCEMIP